MKQPTIKSQLETILEHFSHAWNELQKRGLAPETAMWPPDVPSAVDLHYGCGTPAYHVAAALNIVWGAWSSLPSEEPTL